MPSLNPLSVYDIFKLLELSYFQIPKSFNLSIIMIQSSWKKETTERQKGQKEEIE